MIELADFLKLRDEVFNNPTIDSATALWNKQGFPPPVHFTVPLAAVHKARLQWLDATDMQIMESRHWLLDNGYEPTSRGISALTPERRDAERVAIGKKPLNQH